MTIRYSNGYTVEAVLLARTEDSLRVQMRGVDDVVEFRNVDGRWISEDCEPVEIEFAWAQLDEPTVVVDDCICSPELAARLLHLLFSGEASPESVRAVRKAGEAERPVHSHVV